MTEVVSTEVVWWTDLVWITPFIGAGLAGLAGLFNKRLSGFIGTLSIAVSALLTIPLLLMVLENPERAIVSPQREWLRIPAALPGADIVFRIGSYVDGLAAVMSVMVAWVSLLIAIYSLEYMRGDYGEHRYWLFFTFFVGSMLLLVMASDLLLFLIGWEGTSLASYALIGHWYRDDDENTFVGERGRAVLGKSMFFSPSHSGVRAIVMTGAADIGLLIGVGSLIFFTGTSYIPDLYSSQSLASLFKTLASSGLLTLFLFVTSLGALAKSAQFPLHEWLVTAMTGPASVSALIHAATMVKAGVYFMLRFSPIIISSSLLTDALVVGQVKGYFEIIASLGAFTAFMMATMAIVARELKLIWAFSTASQIGYMFVAAASSGLIQEPGLGIVAGLSHLLSHAVFKAALFLAAGALIHAVGSRFINDMRGVAGHMRVTVLSSYIAALSLASVPPLAGFWSKDLVIEVSEASGLHLATVLLFVTAFLTAYYSMRAVGYMFMRPVERPHVHEASPVMYVPYLLLALGSIVMGLVWWYGVGVFAGLVTTSLPIGHVSEVHLEVSVAYLSIAVALSASIASILVYQVYGREVYPVVSRRYPVSRYLHDFLYDRWGLNPVLYIVFVDGFGRLARLVGRYMEYLVIDSFYHSLLTRLASLVSRGLRAVQIGFINLYLMALVLGLVLLLLIGVGLVVV